MHEGMKIISLKKAMELFDKGEAVYMLNEDGTAELIEHPATFYLYQGAYGTKEE